MGNSLSFPLNKQSNSLSHNDQVPLPYWEIGRGVWPNNPDAFFFCRQKRKLPSVSTGTSKPLPSETLGNRFVFVFDQPTRASLLSLLVPAWRDSFPFYNIQPHIL
jgi:hypothetical protein